MDNLKFVSWGRDRKYSLVSGGLLYSVMRKLKIAGKGDAGVLKRAVLFALVAWLPLLILTLIEGTFSGEKASVSFVEDFLVHIKFLLVIPFFIVIEKMIDPLFDNYMNSTRRLIAAKEDKDFTRVAQTTEALSNSWIPEIVVLVLIYGAYLLSWTSVDVSVSRWNMAGQGARFSLGEAYYLFVAIPIYQVLVARWVWRWLVWAYSVVRISLLDLRVEATHADQLAGLSFMELVPVSFCVLSLAFSAVFSATIGEDILFYDGSLREHLYAILFFIFAAPVVLHLPLLAFIPVLIKAKVRAINKFSSLIQYHNNLYRDKWMEGSLPEDDHLLGSLDNSSMSDINGAYAQSVRGMNVFAMAPRTIVYCAFMLILPFLPLLLTMYSTTELIKKFFGIITG